jgi:AraC family transcriptional regulator, positive regulator of tynA and feaB
MKYYSSVATRALPHANHLYTLDTDAFSIDVDPIDQQSYRAIAEVASLGPLTVAKVESNAAVVTRKTEDPNDVCKRYSIIVAVDGDIMLSHHLGMSELKTGDFILMDNTLPRTMFIYQQVSLLIISIPEQVLQRFIPRPEEVEAQKMTTLGMQTAFYEPVLILWEAVKKSRLREFAPTLSDKLLSAVSEVYSAHGTSQGGRASKRVTQVKKIIEEQLGNPELTVESLATSLGVSSRYLRDLFSHMEKVSHYILRRRLEECANQLANALQQSTSITAIAFQYGFNSTAHFSRTFRKQYGLTPREYRRQHLQKPATAANE